MAATVIAPRYSADDFETGSIRSAAPSYVSDAPSYHSIPPYGSDASPPSYTPPANNNRSTTTSRNTTTTRASASRSSNRNNRPQTQTIGLPPIPPVPNVSVPNLHNFRIPNWSTHNAPAARQLHSVIERRVNAAVESNRPRTPAAPPRRPYQGFLEGDGRDDGGYVTRPLEDPYLVGERAAAQNRQDRICRERGDDILLQEDKRWDWMLAQMRSWDERERAWGKFRREVETGQRKRVLRHIGGRFP